ncbi:hypothetical protein [Acinetobacter rudis]|uniref:hypothetical protein n=1 Tax=Acinetobacter rudis TaxID=632955 RepID=UPI00333EB6E9
MFKDIELPFKTTIMELSTLLFFIMLGYLSIYKYAYYEGLGVPWINSLTTPTQLFSGSIGLIVVMVMSALFCLTIIVVSMEFKKHSATIIQSVALLLYMISLYPVLTDLLSFLLPEYYFYTLKMNQNLNFFGFSSFMILSSYLFYFLKKNQQNVIYVERIILKDEFFSRPKRDNKFIFIIVCILMFFIFTPLTVGDKNAKNILENKQLLLNEITLKDSKDKWYLLEVMGDKIIIIKDELVNDDGRVKYKMVEYKEIKEIYAKKEKDFNWLAIDMLKKYKDKD